MLEFLNSLECLGLLQRMARNGMMPPHFISYREIYFKVDLQMKVKKLEKTAAVKAVAREMVKPERTVWNAMQLMESPAP